MPKARFGWGAAASLCRSIAARDQVVRPRDFVARKVQPAWLYFLAPHELKQVGPGLFIWHEFGDVDPLVLLARKYPGVTLGLTTALWAHGLIERPPHDWWVIGARDRRPTLPCERARFVRSSWPREDRGPVEVLYEKCFIESHSVVRAVLDCVRFRTLLGEQAVDAALRAVLASNHPEFAMLDIRAAELHVYRPFRTARRRVLSAGPPPTPVSGVGAPGHVEQPPHLDPAVAPGHVEQPPHLDPAVAPAHVEQPLHLDPAVALGHVEQPPHLDPVAAPLTWSTAEPLESSRSDRSAGDADADRTCSSGSLAPQREPPPASAGGDEVHAQGREHDPMKTSPPRSAHVWRSLLPPMSSASGLARAFGWLLWWLTAVAFTDCP